ncbi:hypothetical protein Tco_1433385, partial [Tanacetum coccineum]
ILVYGLSWSIDVHTGESAKSIALGATATGTGETAIVGGLKYSSNIGWNKRSHSSLGGGIQVTIPHSLCNLVVTEPNSTEKLVNKIGELRAISSHVLGAFGVQIPQENLDNLRSTEEEDGATEVLDPRDVSGSVLLEITYFAFFGLLLEPLVLGFDLLDLVDRLTPVEVDTKLLVVCLVFVWEEPNYF